MISLSELAPWIAIGLSVLTLVYSHFHGQSKDHGEKFKALDERLEHKASKESFGVLAGKVDILEDRATRIETDMRHLPDHSTVKVLEGMIANLSKDVGVLSERIRPVAAIADRLQEKIMEKAGFD